MVTDKIDRGVVENVLSGMQPLSILSCYVIPEARKYLDFNQVAITNGSSILPITSSSTNHFFFILRIHHHFCASWKPTTRGHTHAFNILTYYGVAQR